MAQRMCDNPSRGTVFPTLPHPPFSVGHRRDPHTGTSAPLPAAVLTWALETPVPPNLPSPSESCSAQGPRGFRGSTVTLRKKAFPFVGLEFPAFCLVSRPPFVPRGAGGRDVLRRLHCIGADGTFTKSLDDRLHGMVWTVLIQPHVPASPASLRFLRPAPNLSESGGLGSRSVSSLPHKGLRRQPGGRQVEGTGQHSPRSPSAAGTATTAQPSVRGPGEQGANFLCCTVHAQSRAEDGWQNPLPHNLRGLICLPLA